MSYCEDSNINKSYIVQNVDSSDIFSACTEIYITNITPCTGDTININSNLNVTGNVSGTTFYGDGSQLSGIITTDNYVTGGVYTASTKSLYFTGTTGFTPFSIDVSALLDDTNNYVTGGTYNPSTDIISLFRNDNVTIDITGVTDTFTTGGTYDNGTSLITFVKNDNTSYTVDLSTIDVNDTFVTGSTLNGDALTIRRNDGVDIVVTGFSQTFTGNTNTTCIGDIYVSNIHSCSPLRINSNDEGNVYFGSTSGITIDLLNQRVGIGTNNPAVELHVKGSASILRLETTQSQNSNFVEFHDPLERKGWIGYPGSTSSIDSFFIRNEEHGSKIIISTTDISGTSRTAINIDGNHDVQIPFGNFDVAGVVNIGTLGTGTSINNLGIDSIGNVVVGTTGDTDTNIFVTGGTLSSNDLILEKNNGVDVNPIDLSGLVSGKTDLTLFNSHTGDTNNPHQTSFSGLTSTAHTHTLSEVTDFNTYSGSVQTQIDGKTDNTDFISHTGDTAIHFTKGDISLSEIGNSAHTHTLSEITDFNTYSGSVQTQLDGKVETILFNSHTGDTNNPHDTSFSNLTSTAHTHTISDVINLQNELDGKLNVSEFNTYSGNVQTELNTKISGATNLSSEGVFAQKNGLDLEFKGLTSTGGTVNISSNSNTVNLEVTIPTDQDKFVSGGTYNGGTKEINFVGNSVDTTFDVDLTSLVSSVSANTYVINGVYNDSTDTLSLLRNDGNFVNITGITDTFTTGATYDNGTTLATFTKNDGTTYTLDLSTIDVNDTFVTGQTFSNSTYILSTTRNDGTTFNTDLSVLATDVYVVSGVYDVLTGVVTYTNSSGGTFQVSGFTTGMTDSYTTAANLNGETIEFDNNIQGSNLYSVDLTPLLSGKTDNTEFTSHTGDTTIHFTKSSINLSDLGSTAHTHTISDVINLQTELDGKTDNTEFTSHTGDTTIHFTKSSINLSDLGSTAHTHTLSEITDFNTYSGSVQTQLDTKVENGINSGGANEVFSGKSGTDLYFRTLSGGTNTTVTTVGNVIKIDSTGGSVSSGPIGISDSGGTYTYYSDFATAIAAASAGDTIEMFADIEETGSVTVTLVDGVKINGNGHSYTLSVNDTTNAFTVSTSGDYELYNLKVIRTGRSAGTTTGFAILNNNALGYLRCFGVYFINDFGHSCNGRGKYYGVYSVAYLDAIRDAVGNAEVYDSYAESTGTGIGINTPVGYIYNSIGKGVSSHGIVSNGRIYNSTGISTGGYGISSQNANSCVAISSTNYGGNGNFKNSTLISVSNYGAFRGTHLNCSIISSSAYGINEPVSLNNCYVESSSNVALSFRDNSNIVNSTINCKWNNTGGHGTRSSVLLSNPIVANTSIKVANASAYCLNMFGGSTLRYANNSFQGATTPVNTTNVTQGITNTSDSQGNILI